MGNTLLPRSFLSNVDVLIDEYTDAVEYYNFVLLVNFLTILFGEDIEVD